MNQAFFKKVWVSEDGVVGWQYNRPFAALMRAHQASEPILVESYEATAQIEADEAFGAKSGRPHYRRSPGRWARASCCQGSNQNNLAERVGFEPTVSFPTHDFQSCRFGRSRTPPRTAVS